MAPDFAAEALAALDLVQAGLDKLRASLTDPEPSAAVRMVSLKDAARRLGMSDRTLRRKPEAYGGVKAGGAWRFDPDKLTCTTYPTPYP